MYIYIAVPRNHDYLAWLGFACTTQCHFLNLKLDQTNIKRNKNDVVSFDNRNQPCVVIISRKRHQSGCRLVSCVVSKQRDPILGTGRLSRDARVYPETHRRLAGRGTTETRRHAVDGIPKANKTVEFAGAATFVLPVTMECQQRQVQRRAAKMIGPDHPCIGAPDHA